MSDWHDHGAEEYCAALEAERDSAVKTMLAIRDQRDKYSAEVADLREQLAAAQSKEVCTVAHSDEVMEFCPYCKIERLQARLAGWDKAADFYRRCKADPKSHEVGAMQDAVEWLCLIAARAADNADEVQL